MQKKEQLFRGPNLGQFNEREERADLRTFLLDTLAPFEEGDPEIEAFLDSLDFAALRNLYTRDLRRSVRPVKDGQVIEAQIVPRDRFILVNADGFAAFGLPSGAVMAYTSNAGVILVNVTQLRASMAQHSDIPRSLVMLKTLVHEEFHGASSHGSSNADMRMREAGDFAQLGLTQHEVEAPGKLRPALYDFLNEAITEKRAHELAAEYARSHPLPGVAHKDIDRFSQHPTSSFAYVIGMYILDEVIKRVARDAGQSERTVWESIVHSVMTGLNLSAREARVTLDLDSVFGRGFISKLGSLRLENARQFMEEYDIDETDEFIATMRGFISRAAKPS